MILLLLLTTSARSQEIQAFDPQVADVVIDGKKFEGILIDEATYIELGDLRLLKTEQTAKLVAYQDWEGWSKKNFESTIEALREECGTGQARLVDHYEQILRREKRRDFFQQHGFAIGISVGLVGSTAAFLGAVDLYGNIIER